MNVRLRRRSRGPALLVSGLVCSLCVAPITGCSGGSNALSALSAPAHVLAGVNDHPRDANSANFVARRAAAHARGLFLTDELNATVTAIKLTLPPKGGKQTSCNVETDSLLRAAQDLCGVEDNGGFTVQGLGYDPVSWDTEIDFTDGTSMLGIEGGPDNLDILSPDGSYDDLVFDPSNRLLASQRVICVATEIPGQDFSCMPAPNKSWCPAIAGGTALGAKWGVAKKLGSKAGDVAGLVVGLSILNLCNWTLPSSVRRKSNERSSNGD